MVVMAGTCSELQNLTDKLAARAFGMEISEDNTKVMVNTVGRSE